MKNSVIELKDVWKVYEMGESKVEALRGLTLQINKGEFVAVQGPSGSGKSTTFNMIGCLDLPTKGKILLDGYDISKLTENELAQIRGKKIGFVFQTFNLMPSITTLDNVTLPLIFQGNLNKDSIHKAKELLIKVGLGHRMGHKPNQLSGGERQRVAIARALINDPEVILADEPTGNLDTKNGELIMNMLGELNKKEKKTIVLVTHEKIVSSHAHRVIKIRDGRVEK
ncbi:ABC transporter ATP-binding protein [Candidatus Woesearchaeota archaeon]|nr:MAG: hypothetical protein QT09_C0003G0017 [archaeon GW2011_AR18]MBS3162172.1 ABC transporter ATP-binding protein [Candidatus Woesearchaeota archaeon]HIH26234.1 ABC transporter ATP-binding protein [Nanoarchaeota archaeon]